MERYADPNDPLNGPEYHTGKECLERKCGNPAGTGWSPFWCQPCNAKRMSRISATLEHELARMKGKVPPDSMPPHQRTNK